MPKFNHPVEQLQSFLHYFEDVHVFLNIHLLYFKSVLLVTDLFRKWSDIT